jgi:transcriptional regulator with XRE-family HTH domain
MAVEADLGPQIRRERQRVGISLRELARRVGVSASLLSQVETGRTHPSVSTLYAIVSELEISLDDLFDATSRPTPRGTEPQPAPAPVPASALPVPSERRVLHLEMGVTWEQLSHALPHLVDFMLVTYPPGARSSPSGALMRHAGIEYAYLLRGELKIYVGFEEFLLKAGDAISFDSSRPHMLVNEGPTVAQGVWFVLGRRLAELGHQPGDGASYTPIVLEAIGGTAGGVPSHMTRRED